MLSPGKSHASDDLSWKKLLRFSMVCRGRGRPGSLERLFRLPSGSPPLSLLPLPFGPEIFGFRSIFGEIAVAASPIGN